MFDDHRKIRIFVLSLLALCWITAIALWIYSWDLAFSIDAPDIEEASENFEKPWRGPARAMFAAIMTVGGLTLSAFSTWRAKNLLSDL